MNLSLHEVLSEFPLDDASPWMLIVDVDAIAERLGEVVAAFPKEWLHAVALKAHPLARSLERLKEEGAGMEAASFGEVELALAVGCPPEKIVYDSPVKTRTEIARALEHGITINADNLQELERIAALVGDEPPKSRIGLRVNPEVGTGRHKYLSVGMRNSKFGVSLLAQEDAVVEAFAKYEWLTGLHVHIGSQGYALQLLTDGVRRVVDLAVECGAAWVDIGGGMAVKSSADDEVPAMAEYAQRLQRHVPELFDGTFEVITEFGRWIFSGAATAVSTVEYVKPAADVTIATIHFGGDLMIRHIYNPGQWYHPLVVYTSDGTPKDGATGRVTIGGPLCFGSDIIAQDVAIVVPQPGDIISVGNVGAYTFSMWSAYCGRSYPRIIGIEKGRPLGISEPTALWPVISAV